MKLRRILLTSIIILYVLLVSLAVLWSFSINSISVKYKSYNGEKYSFSIETRLNEFKGENILFLDTDKLVDVIEENTYLEVTDIKKIYPNDIEINVVERRGVYLFNFLDKDYVISDEGYVLDFAPEIINERDYIRLSLENIEVKNIVFGKKLFTDYDSIFDCGLYLCKKINLTDCVKSLNCKCAESTDISAPYGSKQCILTFGTYTEVDVIIYDALIRGEEKIISAFNVYDISDDYIKMGKGQIAVYVDYKNNDKICVVWTR